MYDTHKLVDSVTYDQVQGMWKEQKGQSCKITLM